MLRSKKIGFAMLSVVLMSALQFARAQDTTMPTEGTATITVTVVDDSGKPVAGARVSLLPGKVKKATTEPTDTPAKPTPLQTSSTGADGTASLTKVADGSYSVQARVKGQGSGKAKVIVADGKDTTVSVTLKPKQGK